MSVQSTVVPLAVIEQPPAPVAARWTAVARCPACESDASAACALLPDDYYVFGAERVAYPDQGIAVTECGDCGLYYKSMVPTRAYLAEVFKHQAEWKWASPYNFHAEAEQLRRWTEGAPFDVLDIGAAGGDLLAACGGIGATERRSALDVMRYSGIDRHLNAEFIQGFLDDPLPAWSGDPYDVVTLFDVLEHLFQPRTAFENLRALVRAKGLVVIETGNSASFWPRRMGVNHWWYVRLLEHHIFWSRKCVERIAGAHGFRVAHWREVRHKSRRWLLRRGAVVDVLKTGLYVLGAQHYARLAHHFGRQGNQPWFPFTSDHFQAWLVRE